MLSQHGNKVDHLFPGLLAKDHKMPAHDVNPFSIGW